MLRCFGVALHETFHAKHTKRWAVERDVALADSSDPAERQLAVDRRLLEEPRMEAHGVREFPAESVRGRFVRRALEAAVIDVMLPRFAEQLASAALAARALSPDMAGRASVYLWAMPPVRPVQGLIANPAVTFGNREPGFGTIAIAKVGEAPIDSAAGNALCMSTHTSESHAP